MATQGSFQILPPDGSKDNHDANWRNLQQSLYSGAWVPQPISGGPTISGTGLVVQGYYTQAITGVLFFSITMQAATGNVSLTWTPGQYLLLPKPLQYLGVPGGGYPSTVIQITSPTTSTLGSPALTVQNLASNTRLGVLINNTASTLTVTTVPTLTLQGFYFVSK
jgi:hypothetical protein